MIPARPVGRPGRHATIPSVPPLPGVVRGAGIVPRVQTVGLSISHSFEVAGVLTVAGAGMSLAGNARVRWIGAFVREAAVIGVLYAVWQLAGEVSITGTQDALPRGLDRARRTYLPLPSERTHAASGAGASPALVRRPTSITRQCTSTMHAAVPDLAVRAAPRPIPAGPPGDGVDDARLPGRPAHARAPPRMLPGIVDTGLLTTSRSTARSGRSTSYPRCRRCTWRGRRSSAATAGGSAQPVAVPRAGCTRC